jgi:hypothetical protein
MLHVLFKADLHSTSTTYLSELIDSSRLQLGSYSLSAQLQRHSCIHAGGTAVVNYLLDRLRCLLSKISQVLMIALLTLSHGNQNPEKCICTYCSV